MGRYRDERGTKFRRENSKATIERDTRLGYRSFLRSFNRIAGIAKISYGNEISLI